MSHYIQWRQKNYLQKVIVSESPKISVASFPSLFFAISSILGDISIPNSCSAIFNSFISLVTHPFHNLNLI